MFALIWLNTALDELAVAYVSATAEERERMAAGVEALNARLRSDPMSEGESRTGGFRITFTSLLAVVFHVDEQNREVRVTAATRFGR